MTRHIDPLMTALRAEYQRAPFVNLGFVILPDHLHALWRLPPNDTDYSNRWRRIKTAFFRTLPRGERISNSRSGNGERGIGQRRFWEHTLKGDTDFRHHLDYIPYNPVKHGLVIRVVDWPHSSFHEYVKKGIYSSEWGGGGMGDGDFGE